MSGFWSIITPVEDTNLVTNPSIELDTTGYTAVGGSVARNTDQQRYGAASLAVTPTSGTGDGVYFGTVSLESGSSYTFAVDVRGVLSVPYKIYFATTGGTLKGTATTLTGTGDWQRVSCTWEADATASFRLYIIKNSSASTGVFYVDGLDCKKLAYETTHTDGDQEGCKWLGAEHGSQSKRDGQSRAGGRVINLDDYSLYVTESPGVGMPPVVHRTQEYALLPGARFTGSKVAPRTFELLTDQVGTSRSNLHYLRKQILDAIKSDAVSGEQALLLRYTGANSAKAVEIAAVYDSGAGFNPPDGFTEQAGLRFIAYDDPFFYEVGNTAKALTVVQSLTDDYILQRKDGEWQAVGALDSYILSLVFDTGQRRRLYAGGNFTNEFGYWDGSSWTYPFADINAVCRCLAVRPDGDVYVAGDFTLIGGVAATRIALFDADAVTASALGTGMNAEVYALAVDKSGNLYAGGSFTTAGGTTVNYIAKWNGSAWSALGSGTNGSVYAIAIGRDDYPVIGGSFTQANGVPCSRVARWNGTTFEALGGGTNGIVRALMFSENGDLYACGEFTLAGTGGDPADRAAAWNGQVWKPLVGGAQPGVDGTVWAVEEAENGTIYLGGEFTLAGSLSAAPMLAGYNGFTFFPADIYLPSPSSANAINGMAFGNDVLYIGGTFNSVTSWSAAKITALTNSGSRTAYPVFHAKCTGGTGARLVSLRNETTLTPVYMDYTLLPGEELEIDFRPGRRNIRSSFFGSVSQAVIRNSKVGSFFLAPGSNNISCLILAQGGATATAWLEWRNCHWSADGPASA